MDEPEAPPFRLMTMDQWAFCQNASQTVSTSHENTPSTPIVVADVLRAQLEVAGAHAEIEEAWDKVNLLENEIQSLREALRKKEDENASMETELLIVQRQLLSSKLERDEAIGEKYLALKRQIEETEAKQKEEAENEVGLRNSDIVQCLLLFLIFPMLWLHIITIGSTSTSAEPNTSRGLWCESLSGRVDYCKSQTS